jgi:hypothetical protein
MSTFLPSNSIRKVCALLAATAILPVLAYAGTDNGNGNNGQNNGNQNGRKNIPVVPEANAGWVLVPFFGVVLLFSARRLFRAKATE